MIKKQMKFVFNSDDWKMDEGQEAESHLTTKEASKTSRKINEGTMRKTAIYWTPWKRTAINAQKKYDALKQHGDNKYTGMRIGGSHKWHYDNGLWKENKVAPDLWDISFKCRKSRSHNAPKNTGAARGSKFHWFIVADQIAEKMDANSYKTNMTGLKFKVGHKRPYWKTWSYNYPGQKNRKEKIIEILERALKQLKTV